MQVLDAGATRPRVSGRPGERYRPPRRRRRRSNRARRTVQTIVSDLEETKFDGNRYAFEPLVESVDSAKRIGDRLRPQFDRGITLVGSEELSAVRKEVYTDGEQDVTDALDEAERSFERSPENVEEGLDVGEAELVQLRRVCRLLAAASRLLADGYYTVVIESSFVATERTI